MNPQLLVQPEWAVWRATDKDGRKYWYEFVPDRDWEHECWKSSVRGGLVQFAGYADGPQPTWSKSLEAL